MIGFGQNRVPERAAAGGGPRKYGKKELLEELGDRVGIPAVRVRLVFEHLHEITLRELEETGRIRIPGIVRLERRIAEARRYRTPESEGTKPRRWRLHAMPEGTLKKRTERPLDAYDEGTEAGGAGEMP